MIFGFIIPVCCREDIHLRQLHRCIDSIRKFYFDNHIILVNDSLEKYNIEKIFSTDKNIQVIKSYNKGSADQQLFKVLLETTLFDKAVFIQDSMLLNKKLEDIENIDFKFIWHFTNHRVHWDIIKEPKTEYNIKNNILSHTDLIRHNVLRDYSHNDEFQKFCIDKLNKKNEWVGCFGGLCMLSKSVLNTLNKDIDFIDNFINSTSNRDRRVNESIFALLCHYKYPNIKFNESYDGLYYNGSLDFKSNKNGISAGFDDLKWCTVHDYFSKISFNR
jgi:hypothetical protein